MLKQERADYIRVRLEALYPETPVPLDHKDPYTLLVAVLLSAQCTDVRVNQVTPALFALADEPQTMAKVPVPAIQEIVRPCGLAPRKAKAIRDLSEILVREHNAEVPQNLEALEALPRCWSQDSFRRHVSSFWCPCISCRHSHSSVSSTVGPHQRKECGPNRG